MKKYTSQEFIEHMGGFSKKINVGRSTKAQDLTFFDVFGTRYAASTGDGMLYNLANFVGKETLVWDWEAPYWVSGKEEEVVSPKATPVLKKALEEVTEPVKEEVVINAEVKEDKKQPDWDWISSLENKKFDKVKLDEYAESEFGIKLARNKTLENMVKDLKAALEG